MSNRWPKSCYFRLVPWRLLVRMVSLTSRAKCCFLLLMITSKSSFSRLSKYTSFPCLQVAWNANVLSKVLPCWDPKGSEFCLFISLNWSASRIIRAPCYRSGLASPDFVSCLAAYCDTTESEVFRTKFGFSRAASSGYTSRTQNTGWDAI